MSDNVASAWALLFDTLTSEGPEPWRDELRTIAGRWGSGVLPSLSRAPHDVRLRWEAARLAGFNWLVGEIKAGRCECLYAEGSSAVPNTLLRLEFLEPLRINPYTWDVESLTTGHVLRLFRVRRLAPAKAGKPRSGRPANPLREKAKPQAMEWLELWGLPVPGDGQQAKLEKHINDWLSMRVIDEDGHPHSSTVRMWVREWIAELRQKMSRG